MNKSFFEQDRLYSEVLPFISGVLDGYDIRAEEGSLTSIRVGGGKFVYGAAAEGYPLPVQRFLRLHIECHHLRGGRFLWQHGIGCAILLVDANLDEVYLAASLNEPPRRVTLGQAIDFLVERHLTLGGAA